MIKKTREDIIHATITIDYYKKQKAAEGDEKKRGEYGIKIANLEQARTFNHQFLNFLLHP